MTTPQVIGWLFMVGCAFFAGVIVGTVAGRLGAERERAMLQPGVKERE